MTLVFSGFDFLVLGTHSFVPVTLCFSALKAQSQVPEAIPALGEMFIGLISDTGRTPRGCGERTAPQQPQAPALKPGAEM